MKQGRRLDPGAVLTLVIIAAVLVVATFMFLSTDDEGFCHSSVCAPSHPTNNVNTYP